MAVASLGSTARLIAVGFAAGALATPAGAQDRDLSIFGRDVLGGRVQLGGPPLSQDPTRAKRGSPDQGEDNPAAPQAPSQDQLRAAAGDRIFFSEGSAEIGARGRTVLAAQAAWLGAHRHIRVLVEGHADDRLPAHEARALAEQRAQAVRRRLVAEGVGPERINVTSQGMERRIAVCPQPECAAQNRRVLTLVLTPTADAGSVHTRHGR